MRIAAGSDEATTVTRATVDFLRSSGHDVVEYGPLSDRDGSWVSVAEDVARAVAEKECDVGLLFCFTGTGVSIAANKVPGARAALCVDAETARGARRWNDANILVLSYRLASNTVAKEIASAFLSEDFDEADRPLIEELHQLEQAP